MKRLLLAVVSIALAAPAFAASDDAFKIKKRDFKRTYQVIALMPVDADPYLEMSDTVAAMLEQEVTARLEKRGYTVLPSSVLAGIRSEMAALVGGTDEAGKELAVREHAFRELWFRHQFDAVASIRLAIYPVPMESDRVEWDGTRQRIDYEGRSKKYSANVNVTSVVVGIYDSRNTPLYVNYGGLEPIMWREGEQLQPLPADRLLLDEKKIRKAAQIAVDPI